MWGSLCIERPYRQNNQSKSRCKNENIPRMVKNDQIIKNGQTLKYESY